MYFFLLENSTGGHEDFPWLFTNFPILIVGKFQIYKSKRHFPKNNNSVLYLFLQENSAGDHVDFPFSGY